MEEYRSFFFFFNDTATTEIYTLSLHDALPILRPPARSRPRAVLVRRHCARRPYVGRRFARRLAVVRRNHALRSEEHTSELQSRQYLVCRLLLEKKKTITISNTHTITLEPSIIH